MADLTQLRHLIAYNQWADERVLAAMEGLSAEDRARPREAYFGTLDENLRHTVGAQRIWLARWRGETPNYGETFTRPWREVYAETHAALRAFVEGLSEQAADAALRYQDSRGVTHQQPLSRLIAHVVNHGTGHRAEAGLLLERLGRSPGDLDYSLYCRQHP